MPRKLLLMGVVLVSLVDPLSSATAAQTPALSGHSATAASVGAGQLVVLAPGGARAVITRAPFNLRFLDAGGRMVLSEAPLSALPQPVPATPQAEFGTIGPAPATQYAPLGFLVGTQTITQTSAGQWEGTLGSVTQAGVRYSAQSVLSATRAGDSVLLTLSTNDPSGRQLIMKVSPPHSGNAISVTVRPSSSTGIATMADSFTSPSAEAFHGFGGRHNSLDQHGAEFYNWLQQENVSSGSGSGLTATSSPGGDRYMFPNGPEAAYYVQSSFVSSAGYGFLLTRDEISHWRLDSDRSERWQTEVAAPGLDYVVIPAAPAQAIGELTRITGRQPLAPSWAVGSILDREVKYPSDPPASYEQEVRNDLANIDRYHLHLDGYRLEGWAELSPPVLRSLIAALRARGIHPLLYFRAFVGQDTTGTDDPGLYGYAVSHGYVATHSDGTPYTFVSNFNNAAAMIDFTNPEAVRWWQSRIRAALDLGADGFMQDFGEQVLSDMHFHDGSTGAQMHNREPVLYDLVTRTAVNAYERSHPGRHIFFFTRAGYTGTPGNAAYENANFPGDETTDWTRASGLASQTPDMLNRAIGGAYGFSTDIGGYFDLGPFQPTTKELFLRWAEWAALSPFFRLHGSLLAGTHTPWSYDAQTVRIYEALTQLHLDARPLILKLWQAADLTGTPITRPLWLQDPGDPRAAGQDQEWLLGPNVLVAPVVTQGARSRAVYLPAGCWQSPGGGERYGGAASVTVAAPLDRLPYFFRCGTQPFNVTSIGFLSRGCPRASGRLSGSSLGPVHLGEARTVIRRQLAHVSTRHRQNMDFFCLAPQGIRVGYPSPGLLRSLSALERRRLRARAILVLSANGRYALAGVRPGARVSALGGRAAGTGLRIGRNTWYLRRMRAATGVYKVQRGLVGEVGLADARLTRGRSEALRFLRSFGSPA